MSEPSGTEPNAALQRCTTTFKVTLFRSRKTKQVMFLEAGKDFVDTLFNFLVLPMGTIIHILSHLVYRCDRGPSCNLFSIKEGARCVECNAGLSPHDYYKFSGGPYSVQRIIPPASKGIGFVKENFKFIVTDKLEIKPSTMITSMSVLKNLEITSNDLESNEATASITQVLLLLHSAVISKTCLNDVFGKECEQ
ncbi:hypothetical protein KC19_N001500 [Ceratodon purpureus]|nr:hypothetical protein KC19_N001500 [Ceratodon purpureus]